MAVNCKDLVMSSLQRNRILCAVAVSSPINGHKSAVSYCFREQQLQTSKERVICGI